MQCNVHQSEMGPKTQNDGMGNSQVRRIRMLLLSVEHRMKRVVDLHKLARMEKGENPWSQIGTASIIPIVAGKGFANVSLKLASLNSFLDSSSVRSRPPRATIM